jgi:thioredoxin 1
MPSVAMIPYFEEFASDYPDFLFLSVDVDEVKVMFSGLLFFFNISLF